MLAALLLAGAAFLGLGLGAWLIANPTATPKERLRGQVEATRRRIAPGPVDPILRERRVPQFLRRVAALAEPTRPEELTVLRQRMLQAGLKAPNAVEIYLMVRVLLALALPVASGVLLPGASVAVLALALLFAATVGYYGPAIYVSNLTQRRRQSIGRAMPDALDMLVSCTEAGLGLDAAFQRVAENLADASPELSAEIGVSVAEVSAGVPRVDALRRLEQRTGVPELTSLVNVLIQADRLGTPVAQALRVYASTTRTLRQLRAEEKAAAISPKLTVAMVIFLLPSLFVVILGPAIVNIIREILPSMVIQ